MSPLAHAIVGDEKRGKTMLFLHGILGSGSNWRAFARRLVADKEGWRAVLVDLRKHGASQDFAPPHTLLSCASDLVALETSIGRFDTVVGHSFGGKVALEYAHLRGNLDTVWVLDSAPGSRPDKRGSESTAHIVDLLETLPDRFDTRDEFIAYIERQGVERSVAMWLAMNVRREGDGYVMRVDVPALRALLDDYFMRDLWPEIEDPSRTVKIHFVIGGKSNVLDHGERALANRVAQSTPDRTWVHILPSAGHWVHVDAPDDLYALVAQYT